jgi:hypothetical protein
MSMAIFNRYVSLPEGTTNFWPDHYIHIPIVFPWNHTKPRAPGDQFLGQNWGSTYLRCHVGGNTPPIPPIFGLWPCTTLDLYWSNYANVVSPIINLPSRNQNVARENLWQIDIWMRKSSNYPLVIRNSLLLKMAHRNSWITSQNGDVPYLFVPSSKLT